jgi:hypothetical protein
MKTITVNITGSVVKFNLFGKVLVIAFGKENAPTIITPVAAPAGANANQK